MLSTSGRWRNITHRLMVCWPLHLNSQCAYRVCSSCLQSVIVDWILRRDRFCASGQSVNHSGAMELLTVDGGLHPWACQCGYLVPSAAASMSFKAWMPMAKTWHGVEPRVRTAQDSWLSIQTARSGSFRCRADCAHACWPTPCMSHVRPVYGIRMR